MAVGAWRVAPNPPKGAAPAPWRLPALHSPFGETEKGKPACPAPSKNRESGALASSDLILRSRAKRGVSKDGLMVRDAPLRGAPHHEGTHYIHPPPSVARLATLASS